MEFEHFELREERDGEVWLWGFGEYPEHSVLAGQPLQCRIEAFENAESAVAEHPNVPLYMGKPEKVEVFIPKEPPAWFDPMDAGEVWGEDDY